MGFAEQFRQGDAYLKMEIKESDARLIDLMLLRRKLSIVYEMKQLLKPTMKIKAKAKSTRRLFMAVLVCGMMAASIGQAIAQTDQDLIEVARSVVQANREAVVVSTMNLTETEDKDFWPLYHEYRHEMDKINDLLMALVLKYAKAYPNVSEDRAKEWLKEYTGLQQKQVDRRTAYFKKFSKILSAAKALRFAQVETRLDLMAQLQLAAQVPLVPTGGDK
jgi:hypothetical protein